MKRFLIEIRPTGSALSIGGQSAPRFGGHKATARDAQGRLQVPATALRGALRIELERLLRGLGETVCSAHAEAAKVAGPAEPATPEPSEALPKPCDCAICRLFGQGGTATGTLRLEDGVFQGGHRESREVLLRPQVAVSRRTGTAAENLLLFQETSPVFEAQGGPVFQARGELVPWGKDDTAENLEQDYRNLQAACRALRALGGAKARGLGWVECTVEPAEEGSAAQNQGFGHSPGTCSGHSPGTWSEAGRSPGTCSESASGHSPGTWPEEGESGDFLLTFEALAPLHFGAGAARDFFLPTLDYAPASTVRGALAFALLEQGLATDEERGFQGLFADGAGITFGTARLPGHAPCETRRLCRGGEHRFDDLVPLLLQRRACHAGLVLAVAGSPCAVPGCSGDKASPADRAEGAHEPLRRVRTRTSINRQTGTAMDQQLYAQEVLEPQLFRPAGQPLRLRAVLRNVPPAGREVLLRLQGGTVRLGGKRSKGMGRCRVQVEPLADQRETVAAARRAWKGLHEDLEKGWGALSQVADSLSPSSLQPGHCPLALVLSEPWFPPSGQEAQGPLAAEVAEAGGEIVAAFFRGSPVGRFTIAEARRWGLKEAGEQPSQQAVAAGGVFVYQVPKQLLVKKLEDWVRKGLRGKAPYGHGRFQIRDSKDVVQREGES